MHYYCEKLWQATRTGVGLIDSLGAGYKTHGEGVEDLSVGSTPLPRQLAPWFV